MLKTLLARARQGYRTAAYPVSDPGLPELFRGRPVLDPENAHRAAPAASRLVRPTPCG